MNEVKRNSFIERASVKHNGKYDYSNVIYTNNKARVKITCPVHGEFEQIVANHLNGGECPKCSRAKGGLKRRTGTNEFIQRAVKKHGTKYDYTNSKYTFNDKKLIIHCNTCKLDFMQSPHQHITLNEGCPVCNNKIRHEESRLSIEEFIGRASRRHKDKYDYSKVIYDGYHKPVTIACPIHGDFNQAPSVHLTSNSDSTGLPTGCPKCGYERIAEANKSTTELFVEKSKKLYPDMFDYKPTKYVDAFTKVFITCKKHNYIFEQMPSNHLVGRLGCKRCSSVMFSDLHAKDDKGFMAKAILKHGITTDFSKFVYRGAHTKSTFRCRIHNYEYERSPHNFLKAKGCPKCSASSGEKKLYSVLDMLEFDYVTEYRIREEDNLFRYDVYIKDLNLLIEYDGEQHFLEHSFQLTDIEFKKRLTNDEEKNKLAERCGYKLIRIPYMFKDRIYEYFVKKLLNFYTYRYNKKFYKNFDDLVRDNNLPQTTTLDAMRQYLLSNLLK